MNTPYFTILTASLNRHATIQETLESVKSQTFRSFEHIVVDGGSKDGTIDLLKKYQEKYMLRWTSEPDNGIAEALNKGINLSTGQYIIVLQADDIFFRPDTLASVAALIKKSHKEIYSFPVFLDHPTQGRKPQKPIRHLWYNKFKFIFLHQGCFVKRSVFAEVGDFNTSFKIAMDYDFFCRALKHKYSIEFCGIYVAIMGGNGIGTALENAFERLKEEQMVQDVNEDNIFWRTAQKVFWQLYMPYKKRQLIAKTIISYKFKPL